MRVTVFSEKYKVKRNITMHDVFNEEAQRREIRKILRKQHRDLVKATHGNWDFKVKHL